MVYKLFPQKWFWIWVVILLADRKLNRTFKSSAVLLSYTHPRWSLGHLDKKNYEGFLACLTFTSIVMIFQALMHLLCSSSFDSCFHLCPDTFSPHITASLLSLFTLVQKIKYKKTLCLKQLDWYELEENSRHQKNIFPKRQVMCASYLFIFLHMYHFRIETA